MNEQQQQIADLAAKVLAGILAGQLQKPGYELGNVGISEINYAVNIAQNIVNVVKSRVP